MRESKLACIIVLISVLSLIINGLISTGFPLYGSVRSIWLISIVFHVIAILVPLKLIQDMKLLKNVYIWIYAPFITFFLGFVLLSFLFMLFSVVYFIPEMLAMIFLSELMFQPWLLSVYYILTGVVWLMIIHVRKRSKPTS